MASFMSSYMRTNGTALTRNRDSLSRTYNARPQALTVYVRFVERGTKATANDRLVNVGSNTSPRFILMAAGSSKYLALFSTSNGSVDSTPNATVSINDVVEFMGQLTAAGKVTGIISVNGATSISGTQSAALSLPQVWSAQTVWFNRHNGTTNVGFNAFTNFLIVRGVQSLETMRRIAGTK